MFLKLRCAHSRKGARGLPLRSSVVMTIADILPASTYRLHGGQKFGCGVRLDDVAQGA